MALVGTALTASLFLCACKKPEVAAPPPPIVEVMEITTSEVPLTTTLIGQLDSPQNVEVRARVEGFVDKMLFIEGEEVKQGELIFQLDKKPFSKNSPPPKARWRKPMPPSANTRRTSTA